MREPLAARKQNDAPEPAPAKRMGRPTKLTPELTERIAAHVRTGAVVEVAAAAEGLHRSTIDSWCTRGREAIKAELHGEAVEEHERQFGDFSASVARAAADFELDCLKRLSALDAADIDPKVASALVKSLTWLLERTRRERFGSHITIKVEEAKEHFLDALERVCGRLGATEVQREVLEELARSGEPAAGEAPAAEPVH